MPNSFLPFMKAFMMKLVTEGAGGKKKKTKIQIRLISNDGAHLQTKRSITCEGLPFRARQTLTFARDPCTKVMIQVKGICGDERFHIRKGQLFLLSLWTEVSATL